MISNDYQTIIRTSDTMRLADKKSHLGTIVQTGNATLDLEEPSSKLKIAFSRQRELTPEEQQRVEFLKNLLVQTLTAAQGDPTEDQKKQIREIEDELEKITGMKVRTRISKVTDKLPGKDDEDKEKEKQEQQMRGIAPQNAVHNNFEIKEQSVNPGIQMLRNNAFLAGLGPLAGITNQTGK